MYTVWPSMTESLYKGWPLRKKVRVPVDSATFFPGEMSSIIHVLSNCLVEVRVGAKRRHIHTRGRTSKAVRKFGASLCVLNFEGMKSREVGMRCFSSGFYMKNQAEVISLSMFLSLSRLWAWRFPDQGKLAKTYHKQIAGHFFFLSPSNSAGCNFHTKFLFAWAVVNVGKELTHQRQ